MKLIKTSLYLVPVGLVGMLAVLIWVVSHPPAPPSVTMADGTVLALETVTYGATHRIGATRFPFSLLRRLLPGGNRRPAHQHWSNEDSVGVWLSRKHPQTGRYLDFDWLGQAQIVDEHGCRFWDSGRQAFANGWSASGHPLPAAPPGSAYTMALLVWSQYPRRQKRFQLRLYDLQGRLAATLDVANPAVNTAPAWPPEALPQTASHPEVACTLLAVTNQPRVFERNGLQFASHAITATFAFAADGAPTKEWQVHRTVWQDATGNRGTGDVLPLCTNEAAWKLQAELYRQPQARFHSNEIWRVAETPLPGNGEARAWNLSNTVQGVHVRLCVLAGPGKFTYSNGVPVSAAPTSRHGGYSMSSSSGGFGNTRSYQLNLDIGQPHLLVQVGGMREGWMLSFRGKDDLGKETSESLSAAAFNEYRVFQMNLSTNAKSVELTFMVHEKRVAEFTFRPPPLPAETEWTLSPATRERLARQIPARSAQASPNLIDLSAHYTLPLKGWLYAGGPVRNGSAGRSYDHATLPSGMHAFGGTEFDVRGLVQLSGLSLKDKFAEFPRHVRGVPVGRACRRMHFLHGTVWTVPDGTPIGSYLVHYADGRQIEVPIIYGQEVRDYLVGDRQDESAEASRARIARPQPETTRNRIRGSLYQFTWENPRPEVEVTSLDFISTMTSAAPFLVAITTEPER